MANVRILPPEIVSKIAAGEVIERPASVLKELLENSLDANATAIEVTIQNAGKTLIQIRDNGTGIAEEDMNSVFNRHATSKISRIDDLYAIASLGFRGEALYSIAAVSDITLTSKTKNRIPDGRCMCAEANGLSQKPFTMRTGHQYRGKGTFFQHPCQKKIPEIEYGRIQSHAGPVYPVYDPLPWDKILAYRTTAARSWICALRKTQRTG